MGDGRWPEAAAASCCCYFLLFLAADLAATLDDRLADESLTARAGFAVRAGGATGLLGRAA